MDRTRRSLLGSAAAGAAALALAACASTTNPTTGVVTYSLAPAVVTYIQDAVSAVAKYVPTIESIAAIAAGLFGPAYAAIVAGASSAINTVIAALTGVAASATAAARFGMRLRATYASGQLVGFSTVTNASTGVKTTVPVFSQ